MTETQIDPVWQKVTITVEDPDGATLTTTFPRVEGFKLRGGSGPSELSVRADGYAVREWTDFAATGRAVPDGCAVYSVGRETPATLDIR